MRSPYLKVVLFDAKNEPNLMGSTIVGQTGDYILVERPPVKPRAKKSAVSTPRKPRTPKPQPAPAVAGE
jgi:hypothetical protein